MTRGDREIGDGWSTDEANYFHKTIVRRGQFVYARGTLPTSNRGKIAVDTFYMPTVQVVHPVSKPLEIAVADGGRVVVKPKGDRRVPGDRVKDPTVWNGVPIFLIPDYLFGGEDGVFPSRVLPGAYSELDSEGREVARRDLVVAIGLPSTGLFDDSAMRFTHPLPPPMLVPELIDFLYRSQDVRGYDSKKPFGEGHVLIGRINRCEAVGSNGRTPLAIEVAWDLAGQIGRHFGVRVFCNDETHEKYSREPAKV